MRDSIWKLFEDAFEGGQNNYTVNINNPGYYSFFLSMIKMMRGFIILKQFDISDPDCDEDDKILNWSFIFLKSLTTSETNKLNL